MMTLNEYQDEAARTGAHSDFNPSGLSYLTLGLCGESGEFADHIKKWLGHGHDLDMSAMKKELGDVLWYLSQISKMLGFSLEEVAIANLDKLRVRYPDGFSIQASRNRSG